MDHVILLLSCVAEICIFYDFFCGFFHLRDSFQALWKRVLMLFLLIMCQFCVNLLGNSYLNLVCSCLVIGVCCMLLFRGHMGMKALCCIIALFVAAGCEFLFSALLSISAFIHKQGIVTNLSDIPWHFFTMKLMTYILLTTIKQFYGYSKQEIGVRMFVYYICIPLSSIGIMILTYYIGMDASMGEVEKGLFSACFAIMVFGNMAVFRAFCRYSAELARNAEQELVISKQSIELQYYSQMKNLDARHQEFIHNASHYLKAIGELARENEADSILSVLQGLNVELEKTVAETYCKNSVINAVLAEKKAAAQREGVEMDIYVEPGIVVDGVLDVDIITMLSNLLDNALRAAKTAECKVVTVRMYIQNGGGFQAVKIQNYYKGEVLQTDNGFLSTKKDDGIHGIGIRSVQNTARKYGGELECFVEGQLFTAILLLPVSM